MTYRSFQSPKKESDSAKQGALKALARLIARQAAQERVMSDTGQATEPFDPIDMENSEDRHGGS